MRRLLAVVAVVCGLGILIMPFALSLFDRAPAGERVTDRFRTTMSEEGLVALRTNFATMGALVDQFIHEASPEFARSLHMTPAEYDAYVSREFPKVAAGVEGIPPLVAFVTPVAAQLEALHSEYEAVDSLPFLGLPLDTVPWILLALGGLLIGLGVTVARTSSDLPVAFAAVLGLGMLVVPVALSIPSKAADAQEVADIGKVALSPKAAAGATTANALIDGMVTEVQAKMLPALAHRLGTTTPELTRSVAASYPAIPKGLAAWPRIKPGAVELVRRQVASVGDARTMNGLRPKPLPWTIMGPGIALFIAASLALLAQRTRRRASALRAGGPESSAVTR